MTKIMAFSKRNLKETMRDPLSICFGLGLPLFLLIMFIIIGKNAPVPMFEISMITPGIAVFGFSFLTLFVGMSVAKDRSSSLVMRIYASPLTNSQCILGYLLPIIPLALVQVLACVLLALALGLAFSVNILLLLLFSIVIAIVFIAFGMVFGLLVNERQVGGIFALFVNLSAFFSGVWFDITALGKVYETICYILPFANCVDLARDVLAGRFVEMLPHLAIVLAYAVIACALAVFMFYKKKKT